LRIFDAHCDTASELLNRREKLGENSLHIDLKRILGYDEFTQVFAVFIAPRYKECAKKRAEEIIDNFCRELRENDILLCKSRKDLKSHGKVRAILSLEGGEPIENVSDVRKLYNYGIRMIAPTWNFRNRLACGVEEEEDTGVTTFGKTVIAEMDRLGIILDVSHLSEKSFWDAAEITKSPICASHSNLKSVRNHRRNLTDQQFIRIKESGGVCGINLYPPFFGEEISCIKDHIDAFLALGGEDNIGLGCDFDGVDRLPARVSDVTDLDRIIKDLPYSLEIKEKIAYRNFSRVFEAHNW